MILLRAEQTDIPAIREEQLKNWIQLVADQFGMLVGRITYLFCDDDYMLETNRKYLGHDYYTDIITFDYTARNRISGDIIISLDTVKSNAEQLGVPYLRELARVIIHGVLHLCGINDKLPGEREIMESHEDQALVLIPNGLFQP